MVFWHSTVYLLCFVTCAVQETLDLSSPTYTIEYEGYMIKIFKAQLVTSDATFYYTPAGILLPNRAAITTANLNEHHVTVNIGLWDEAYTRHIRGFLSETSAIPSPIIRPVPFEWMRLEVIDTWGDNHIGGQWKSIANHPKVVTFRIPCLHTGSCDKMEELLKTDIVHFASSIRLTFAYRLPNTTKSVLNMQRDHWQASHTFQAMDDHYPEADHTFMQKSDFDALVRETLKESMMSALHNDEFVDDGQIGGLLRQFSRKLRYNTTSTASFTEAMWDATFWSDESQRPDIKARSLEALFGCRNWLKLVMRGDNVTTQAGISESSPSVARALDDLRAGKDHVQWSGGDIIIKPFKVWCVALGTLREKANLGAVPVWVTKRTADYITATNFASRNNAVQHAGGISGSSASNFSQTFEQVFQVIGNLKGMFEVSNRTFSQVFDMIGNLTSMFDAVGSKSALLETGIRSFNQTMGEVFQMIDNLTSLHETTKFRDAVQESRASHSNHTFQQVFQTMGNLTDMYHAIGSRGIILESGISQFNQTLTEVLQMMGNLTSMYNDVGSKGTFLESSFRHSNYTFGQVFQMIGNLTRMLKAAESRDILLESGSSHLNKTFLQVLQITDNLSSLYNVTDSRSAKLESAVSGFSQTFERVFVMMNNHSRKLSMTDTVVYCTRCPCDVKARATWLVRNANTSSHIGSAIFNATLKHRGSACDQLTVRTNSIGEFSLMLPQNGGYAITFELSGYHPIVLSDLRFEPGAEVIYMEPLLFISQGFTGLGSASGVVLSIPDPSTSDKYGILADADLKFWPLNTGKEVDHEAVTIKTSATGSWKLSLPTGHYKMTVSKSGYITTVSTIAVLGGMEKSYGSSAVTPAVNDSSIRVVLCGNPSLNNNLDLHISGPVAGSQSREHVYAASRSTADGHMVHDVDGLAKPYSSTIIKRQLDGPYRVSVYDFDNGLSSSSWVLAKSRAVVHVYRGSRLWATYFVPNGMGNTWNVVEINGTNLKAINSVKTIDDQAKVD